jgi:hypothetical protein
MMVLSMFNWVSDGTAPTGQDSRCCMQIYVQSPTCFSDVTRVPESPRRSLSEVLVCELR